MTFVENVLSNMVMRVPRPIRRALSDTRIVQFILSRVFGDRRAAIETPEGIRLIVNPLYHAQFVRDGIADYELSVRSTLVKLCRNGTVFYDIGANVGVFTCLASATVGDTGTVVAFEPEPNNLNCLQETVRANRLQNVRIETKAVGKASGTSDFDRRGGAFSGRLIDHGRYRATRNVTEVSTVSLDDYVNKMNGPVPDVVKIDVEGNELLVLEGMQDLLGSIGPAIVCELHAHLGDSPERVATLLRDHQYELIDLQDFTNAVEKPVDDIAQCHCFVATKRLVPQASQSSSRRGASESLHAAR